MAAASKKIAAQQDDLLDIAANTFKHVAQGIIRVEIHEQIPLKDVAKGRAAAESRKTKGSLGKR